MPSNYGKRLTDSIILTYLHKCYLVHIIRVKRICGFIWSLRCVQYVDTNRRQ